MTDAKDDPLHHFALEASLLLIPVPADAAEDMARDMARLLNAAPDPLAGLDFFSFNKADFSGETLRLEQGFDAVRRHNPVSQN